MRIAPLNSSSIKSTFDEYKGWIVLVVVAYLVYAFRGVFNALGSTAGAGAEAASASIRNAAESAVDTQKVKSSGGTTKLVTAEKAATYKADAISLAHMLGHDSFSMATMFKDRAAAFSLLKRSYSRLMLFNNKPQYKKMVGGKPVFVNTSAETPNSIKSATNWRVLVPFYKDATNGRDLLSDLRSDLAIPQYRPFIDWVI